VAHPNGPLKDSENWVGDPDEPLAGFNWRSGIHRETVGIQFWSDVFLCDTQNGVKNCVLLMDTQGMFDNLSSDAENSKLFSLCTLISSLQIYNLPSLIQQDHLQHLHVSMLNL
jgi:atlastin